MEILAPVGGEEQLKAAVRCGANAVYLGTKGFNARRNATNFDREELYNAVSYCHARNVAVHVALNTILKDSETDALLKEIKMIADCGVDAVIVQDLGVAALIKKCVPTLAIHASTQLSTHNAEGAILLKKYGFSRVVLARELSEDEIIDIVNRTGMEVEIFVHGAHCMSMSGNCYMSSMFGERSGNRGLCAQPCRLNFKSRAGEYALSLKDMSLIAKMSRLVNTGVVSLKIEGRMKRPEYVAAAVSSCVDALKGLSPDIDTLQAVFSRSGFTDGYFEGERGRNMYGYRTKDDVTAASSVFKQLGILYKDETPLVSVDMSLAIKSDKKATLVVTDGKNNITVEGDVPQKAINAPTTFELAERSLKKTGSTPFYLNKLSCDIEDGLILPVSQINKMRKQALDELLEVRSMVKPHKFIEPPVEMLNHPKLLIMRYPELYSRLENITQLTEKVRENSEKIILPLSEAYKNIDVIKNISTKIVAEMPMLVFKSNTERVKEKLIKLKENGIDTVMVGSIGDIAIAQELGLKAIGDYSLNIMNTIAMNELRDMGLTETIVSFENSLKNIHTMGDALPYGVIAYGYLPLMTFRNCPNKLETGCGNCKGIAKVTDRMNNDFTLLCREKQYSQLFNTVPLYLGDKKDSLNGLSFSVLYFTKETASECDKVIDLWIRGASYSGKKTGGLYFRDLM